MKHKTIRLNVEHEAEIFTNDVSVRLRDGTVLFVLRGKFSAVQIEQALRVYYLGRDEGAATGRKQLQAELRELLGVEMPW